ncbi:MAG: hypothetical protein QHH26_13515 [Armatimonadota bacterium]|nr:hypothetical protein [Armatimonadota bacterium]
MNLIPIQYHNRKYPVEINAGIYETAAHFDIEKIETHLPCSLHTEYSYGKRNMSSSVINNFPTIRTAHKDYIPQLWFNKRWAEEFADFITTITENKSVIKIIEIHPPFKDYCQSLEMFIEIYKIFEEKILTILPHIDILIENRGGSQYKGGKFLISKNYDVVRLSELIEITGLRLKIVLDFPQLFSSHLRVSENTEKSISNILQPLTVCRKCIKGLHIWGKRKNVTGRWIAHQGNLNTYFDNNADIKKQFMTQLKELFNDNIKRYFVPEVNSSDIDLESIIEDFKNTGFKFS